MALTNLGRAQKRITGADTTSKVSVTLQLFAKPDKERVRSGEAVTVKTQLTNISSRHVVVREMAEVSDYEVMIIREAASPVERTKYGRMLLEEERGGSRRSHDMEPGKTIDYDVEVSKTFVLTEPGRYYARVRRLIGTDESGQAEVAISNLVMITIVPSASPRL